MIHLFEDHSKVLHLCESSLIVDRNLSTKLVWTKCGKDVPANKSFKSHESATCRECLSAPEGGE